MGVQLDYHCEHYMCGLLPKVPCEIDGYGKTLRVLNMPTYIKTWYHNQNCYPNDIIFAALPFFSDIIEKIGHLISIEPYLP
jgi:hypothetical protein